MESSIYYYWWCNQASKASKYDLARAKLMSAKEAAKTEKKRRQLHKQKLYRKNKKKHNSNGKRAKSKKGDGRLLPCPNLCIAAVGSGVLVPDGNLQEDILADGDTGTRRCDVKAEGRREMHIV